MNEENTEIISAGMSASPETLIETTDDILATAERRVVAMQKLKGLALRSTNADDWVNQNGKPYLQASGAEKVARLFGVKIRNVKNEKIETSDEKGHFYYYLVTGIAELKGGGDYIEAVGTCSSKDQFFAKKKNYDTGEMELKPLSEIDETNILKSAYSNFIGNAITRLLGIRNLTWDEVKAAGVMVDKVAKVEYNKGGQGGGGADVGIISTPQVKRLFALCKSVGWKEDEFKAWLKKEYNYDHTDAIKRADYDKICKAAVEIKGGVYESK